MMVIPIRSDIHENSAQKEKLVIFFLQGLVQEKL
jgi:hypothetical protein